MAKQSTRLAIYMAAAFIAFPHCVHGAQRFSRAGYWDAANSPRRVESLSTGWEFSLDGFKTSKRVVLPHGIDEGELGFEASGCVNRRQPAWYRRVFDWTRGGARQFLHFEAIMGKSRVTLNGKVVAEHLGGYLPIHAEVTGTLREGSNVLEVWCDNSDDQSYPPGKDQNILDFAYFGGIYRDAYLVETGEAYVTDPCAGGVWITSVLGADGKWTVETDVKVGGDVQGVDVSFAFDGKGVAAPVACDGTGTARFSFRPENPKAWSPQEPNLHWLNVEVRRAGAVSDSIAVRFGIREIKMTPAGGFVLNGKPYGKKLVGVNRHQDWAWIGNAVPNSLHWRDVKKFKDCGMDVFRCAHYPQDPAFMDACDELGMFVIDATPGWQFWNRKDPRFERRVYDDIKNMVRRDRSRPSLLFWEPILNESRFPARFTGNAVKTVKENSKGGNGLCACDAGSRGNWNCDIAYAFEPKKGRVAFRREWGDFVDDWFAQNSISRVKREWGEAPMAAQARHYMKVLGEVVSQGAGHLGGCLWHGTDHARGYHPDNFFGGILTYDRRKKYSWHAFKASLTKKPYVFAASEFMPYSSRHVEVYSNCTYEATLFGKPFKPGETPFDYVYQHDHARAIYAKRKGLLEIPAEFIATLPDGSKYEKRTAKRVTQILVSLDTEGLATEATGGDMVAAVATIADARGTPKRYIDEEVLFTVEGEADIVGANPQRTRWGEAVVLVRPRASANPGEIKVRAALTRKGEYAAKPGEAVFTPGKADVQSASEATDPTGDAGLKHVAGEQEAFASANEAKKPAIPPCPVPVAVPELLRTFDGTPVDSAETWEKKRAPELLERFQREVYGRRSAAADERERVSFEVFDEREAFGGKAVRKLVRVNYKGPEGDFSFPFTAYIPKGGKPAAAFVLSCNIKSSTFDADGALTSAFWPTEAIVSRGYATAAFRFDSVAADRNGAGFAQGVFKAVQKESERDGASWATLSAWAWADSRILDWMETEPRIDASRVAVIGHSRGGKTALLAAALDRRFAMACSNESGCSGAKLNHIDLPRSESIAAICKNISYWFCENYRKYAGREMEMDFDQHGLIALVAPRLVCVASATKDDWAGPRGEWWAAKLASPAWELYGKKGLAADSFPPPGVPQQEGCISYHLRSGKHDMTPYDWARYMDFADRHGWNR